MIVLGCRYQKKHGRNPAVKKLFKRGERRNPAKVGGVDKENPKRSKQRKKAKEGGRSPGIGKIDRYAQNRQVLLKRTKDQGTVIQGLREGEKRKRSGSVIKQSKEKKIQKGFSASDADESEPE